MKRSAKSMACTINLSQPKTCVRPMKLEKLVDAEMLEECPRNSKYSYQPPRPVSVKICSRDILKTTCSSQMSECSKPADVGSGCNKFVCGIKLLLKGSIVASLIYWSSVEGLWGDSTQTEDLYQRVMCTISPSAADPDKPDAVQLPRLDKITYTVYNGYNRAVMGIVHILITVPTIVSQKILQIVCGHDTEIDDDNKHE